MINKCDLCPRSCLADREHGKTGFCGCTDTVRIARAAPHFWEEPCISGNRGSGTVFFSGCNLRCVFCQNHPLSVEHAGTDVSPERLAEIFLSLQEQNVHNINLVTPTPWIPHIKASLETAWEKGLWLPVVYNSGGYESANALRSLAGYIRIYLPDFKYIDGELASSLSLAPDYPEMSKRSLCEMVRQTDSPVFDSDGIMTRGVIVRHLVLPGHIENSIKTLDYLHEEYGDSIYISIMSQYTPMPDMKGDLSRTLSEDEYSTVVNHALDIGISNAFIQEGGAAKESFIPLWDGTGVNE